MSKMLQAQGVGKLEPAAFAAGVSDTLNGQPSQLTQEQMSEVIKAQQAANKKAREEAGKEALAKGQKFMEENKSKPGVKTLESGLQYQEITAGEGESPKETDKVKVHYRGTLIDGKQFDSSYDRGQPATFGVKGVIPGFSEALMLMKPGGKWKVFIPSELGYGERGAGTNIGANETLIFDLELLEIVK
jgi:FKBP-type peptidyl-prolyl cis-trans isomerase FklB